MGPHLAASASSALARKYGVFASGDVEKVLDNPDIEIVVDLTIAAHKRVWTEEPVEIPSTAPLLMVFERSAQAHSQYRTDLHPRGLCIGVASSWVVRAGGVSP